MHTSSLWLVCSVCLLIAPGVRIRLEPVHGADTSMWQRDASKYAQTNAGKTSDSKLGTARLSDKAVSCRLKAFARLLVALKPASTFKSPSLAACSPTYVYDHLRLETRSARSAIIHCRNTQYANFHDLMLSVRHKQRRFGKFPLNGDLLWRFGGIEAYLEAAQAVMAKKQAGLLSFAQSKSLRWEPVLVPLLDFMTGSNEVLASCVAIGLKSAARSLGVPRRVKRSCLPELRAILEAALLVKECSLMAHMDDGRTVNVTLGFGTSATNLTALLAPAEWSDAECVSMSEMMNELVNEVASTSGVLARRAACLEALVNRELVLKSLNDDGEVSYPGSHDELRQAGLPACTFVLRAFIAAGDVCGSRRWAARLAASIAPHPWRNYVVPELLQDYDALVGETSEDVGIPQTMGIDDVMIGIASSISAEAGRHAALVVDSNGTILANGSDTLIETTEWRKDKRGANRVHAEMEALRKLALANPADPLKGLERARGSTLYIAVFADGGHMTYSRPCKFCVETIKSLGVARVCSSTDTGLENWYPQSDITVPTEQDLHWLDIQDLVEVHSS